jgi:hypothetical protein
MKKRPKTPSNMWIPSNVLRDNSISVLEAIVEFLKEKKGLTYHQIGELINRDERNVWTVYQRAKKKRGNPQKNKND